MTSSRSDAGFRLLSPPVSLASAATEEWACNFPKALHPTEGPGSSGRLVLAAVIAFYIYVHISAGDASCGANMHACMSRRRFIHMHVSWSNGERCTTAMYQSECRAGVWRRSSPQTCSSSSAHCNTAMCPCHTNAIRNGLINPLFALTYIQHVRGCCFYPGTSVRTGNMLMRKNKCHWIQRKCHIPL